jgi:hypothetical protein
MEENDSFNDPSNLLHNNSSLGIIQPIHNASVFLREPVCFDNSPVDASG